MCVCVCVAVYQYGNMSAIRRIYFLFFYSNPFNLAGCVKLLQAMMQACQLDRLHVKTQNPQAPLYPLLIVLFKKKKRSSSEAFFFFFFPLLNGLFPLLMGSSIKLNSRGTFYFLMSFSRSASSHVVGRLDPKRFQGGVTRSPLRKHFLLQHSNRAEPSGQAEGGADRADSMHLSHGGAAQRRKIERGGGGGEEDGRLMKRNNHLMTE